MKTNHEYFGEGTAFPPRHTATQAGFPRQYFPFLKAGEFILPPQHKKGAHLAARPGLIDHLIRVNFRMEVLKAFNGTAAFAASHVQGKEGHFMRPGEYCFLTPSSPEERGPLSCGPRRWKTGKGFKTGMLLQDSRKWCTPEEEYTIPDAVSGKCTTSGVRRVPTSR